MIKLFINNKEVDLNQKDVNVTINYSIENIELGNISGAHSKRNVTLPGTKTNIEIFENIETPTSLSPMLTSYYPHGLRQMAFQYLQEKQGWIQAN